MNVFNTFSVIVLRSYSGYWLLLVIRHYSFSRHALP